MDADNTGDSDIDRNSVIIHRVRVMRSMTTLPLSIPGPSVLVVPELAVAAGKCLARLEGHAPSPWAMRPFARLMLWVCAAGLAAVYWLHPDARAH